MPRTPYITADELREEIQSNAVGSLANEGLYQRAVLAATEAVDKHTHRRFDRADAATARTFRPSACGTFVLDLDDIADDTDLDVAVDTSDNGTFAALDGSAWWGELDDITGMVVAIRTGGRFPSSTMGRRTIQVTARWGWPEIPEAIKRATAIWATRLVNRRNVVNGIVGFGEFGGVKLSTIDPDVKTLLGPYRRTSRMLV